MAWIVVTFEVEDLVAWEKGFHTRGELFSGQGVISPVHYAGADEGNRVVLNAEVGDLDLLKASLGDESAAEAMRADGIVEGSFQLFVLDRKLDF